MADNSNKPIGIVGVGRMGLAILKHLITHGYRVVACDIDPKQSEAAGAAGATTVPTPAEVGKAAEFDRARPIYATFCSDIVHLGEIGAGQFGKAMNNFLLWVNGVALIEAGRLSEAAGIDLVKLREALLKSSGASDALKNWENVS